MDRSDGGRRMQPYPPRSCSQEGLNVSLPGLLGRATFVRMSSEYTFNPSCFCLGIMAHARDDEGIRLGRITLSGSGLDLGSRRFAILRCAKIKNMGNMGASLQHTFRERETPNADRALLKDNTVLHGGETSRAVLDAWKARAPEKIRSNAVHGLEYFVGGSPEALKAMGRKEQDAYFRRALDWLKERHGAENVLSAVIHRDEATPHMTVMTIPLDEHGKLNARAIVGDRGKLSAMQTDFAEKVGHTHGLERGVEGSKATHERVKSAYAHLRDPEEAVELPERLSGGFLGRGRETDKEWRRRASEAATGALVGTWSAVRKERYDRAIEVSALTRQVTGTPAMQHTIDRLTRERDRLGHETRGLRQDLASAQTRLSTQAVEVKRMQAARDAAVNCSKALMRDYGIEQKAGLQWLNEEIDAALKTFDASEQTAGRSVKSGRQRLQISSPPPGVGHAVQPKPAVREERAAEAPAPEHRTRAYDHGDDDGHG